MKWPMEFEPLSLFNAITLKRLLFSPLARSCHQNLKHAALSTCAQWLTTYSGPVPVCPLGSSDFAGQGNGTHLPGCIFQISTQVSPESVNDLSTSLDFQSLAIWQLVRPHFGVLWIHPDLLAIHCHLLLFVHHIVMEYSFDLHCVCLSSISMPGFQSLLVIGPGPGDRLAVVLGESLKSTSVSGRPRSTRPPHCSQRALF